MMSLIFKNVFVCLFISFLSDAQDLEDDKYQLKYIVSTADTCDLTKENEFDVTLIWQFKPKNWCRKYNRIFIRGENVIKHRERLTSTDEL